jgi:DnaJ-class molecular chaperone
MKCVACNGSGKYDSHNSPTCGACNGTGIEKSEALNIFVITRTYWYDDSKTVICSCKTKAYAKEFCDKKNKEEKEKNQLYTDYYDYDEVPFEDQ